MAGYQSGGPFRESDFQKLAQNIGTNIQKISQNVSSIQKMVSQLGTSQDTQSLRDQLHQIQHYTGQLAKDTNTQLKDLQHISLPPRSIDQKQFKLQRERLTNEFSTILNNFQQAQRAAAQKEKDAVKRAKAAHSGISGFGDEPPSGSLIDFEGTSQTRAQIEETLDLDTLQERERAIRQLESDIVDVNHIFKDLATMVHEQGEVIDSIEANVETTTINVSQATEQLKSASTYQNKSRRKKFFIIGVSLVILIIIISLIVYESR